MGGGAAHPRQPVRLPPDRAAAAGDGSGAAIGGSRLRVRGGDDRARDQAGIKHGMGADPDHLPGREEPHPAVEAFIEICTDIAANVENYKKVVISI